ncbi:MAG TPA: hypothetical protein VNZ86_05880, partial [Bacteroidia bacterium]|nr:hypothetical protein [Bacteroidia bacterium]
MEQVSFGSDPSNLLTNELIHNRLNFRYDPDPHFHFRLELRNRIYYGDLVRTYPGFASLVSGSDQPLDLSQNWVNKNSVLFTSTIDRASAEYSNGKWDITLGRQRINWGINTVWTPNDIFNTFNFFDFDYEERPGRDAARIQYMLNTASSLEMAYSPGKTNDQNIAALMYHRNQWNYDLQGFAGICRTDYCAGAGWAGNLGQAGFKGEVSVFTPDQHAGDSIAVSASLSLDYALKNGLYLMASGLYNSSGTNHPINILELSTTTLSAKNIFPFKYTGIVQASYSFTPILKGSFGAMYSPSGNSLIALPSLSYSISDNWALD